MAHTYRKRPVVIEAEQWDGTASSAGRIIDWALALGVTALRERVADLEGQLAMRGTP